MAPIVKMHTLGHSFVPPSIHAGGLRYHGMSPQISAFVEHGYVEARAVKQLQTFEDGLTFPQRRASFPAPESTHAIAVALDEARACRDSGEEKVIVFNLSGHGHFDMSSYDAYLKGQLEDYEYPAEAVDEAMHDLPQVAAPAGLRGAMKSEYEVVTQPVP
jgi:tryptophan synthase beta chain